MPRKRRNPPPIPPLREDEPVPVKPPPGKKSPLAKATKSVRVERKATAPSEIGEPPAPSKHSTTAEVNDRIQIVYELLAWGYSRGQILHFGSKKWDITERQVSEYITRATAMLEELKQMKRDDQLTQAIARLTIIGQKTMRVMDYQRAIAAQRELNLLLGLYAPANVNHKLDDDQFAALTGRDHVRSKLNALNNRLTPSDENRTSDSD